MVISARQVIEFVERHAPIVIHNPTFCAIVAGMSVAMLALYLITRHKAALIVAAASLLYFVPFVKF
jgi:hypothetical protein